MGEHFVYTTTYPLVDSHIPSSERPLIKDTVKGLAYECRFPLHYVTHHAALQDSYSIALCVGHVASIKAGAWP